MVDLIYYTPSLIERKPEGSVIVQMSHISLYFLKMFSLEIKGILLAENINMCIFCYIK